MSQEDSDDEAGVDEAVRRAPTWHATQQYGCSQEDGEGGDDDDEAVRRLDRSVGQMVESPRGLAARRAACGLEMDYELTGELSEAGSDVEGSSALAPGNEYDVSMSDVGAEAEALACDAERVQQREVPVECVVCVGADVGGDGSEARREHEIEGGVEGCVGADGVEQRATRAAHDAEGDVGDEVMAGDENFPLQHAEGGSGLSGGIKKKGKRTRSHRKSSGHRQWLAARGADLRPAADAASVS